MRLDILLDEGEEYPKVFSVWRDDGNGHADLATRRNYVDDRSELDAWRRTRDELAAALCENARLREMCASLSERPTAHVVRMLNEQTDHATGVCLCSSCGCTVDSCDSYCRRCGAWFEGSARYGSEA